MMTEYGQIIPPATNRKPAIARFYWPAIALLTALCTLNLTGFGSLLGRPLLFENGAWDLQRRWVEEQCVRERKSPILVSTGALPPSSVGTPAEPDYPPWALIFGLAFTLPGWHSTGLLFAAWDVAALAALFLWAFRTGSADHRRLGLLLALGVLAIGVNRTVLNIGQYSLVVCGFLAAAAMFDARKQQTLAGLALGVALLKFSISLPFCLCFLLTGRWKPLLVAGILIGVASLVSWPVLHVPPWVTFSQASDIGIKVVERTPTIPKLLMHFRVPPKLAVMLVAAAFGSIGAALIWQFRTRSMLTLFAIACVTARLWTMHYFYDDCILMFLLVALGYRALGGRRAGDVWPIGLVWLALGLSLWATLGYAFRWPGVVLQYATWCVALACLLLAPNVSEVPRQSQLL